MKYYILITNPKIFVEYDPDRNIFRHWNSETHIGKKDKISSYIIEKLIDKKLIPIPRHIFEEMYNETFFIKRPPIEYINISWSIKLWQIKN